MMTTAHRPLAPNQRALLWLAHHEPVTVREEGMRFTWTRTSRGVSISCRPGQLASLKARGLAMVDGPTLVLTAEGRACSAKMRRPPHRVPRAFVEIEPRWLSEDQIAGVRPWFPTRRASIRAGDLAVLSGIVHALRDNLPFARLPDVYGGERALARRFRRWSEYGVMDEILSRLTEDVDGVTRLLVTDSMIWRSPIAAWHARRGRFPILAPVEEMAA